VTPLQWVCRTSANAAILKLLLDAGADPNVLDQYELQNALHYAIDCPVQLVDLLIGAGTTVNQQDRDGITPVMMAAKAGRSDIVTVLINHGADLRSYDKHLRGPLHWAAIGGDRPELVSYLIEAGADPLVRTAYGMTYKDILESQRRKSAP
jgi:ankyrin repeat protein